jgi:hypothetical protein
MADIGKYCKAYYANDLRKFPGFPRPAVDEATANAADDAVLFVHEDLLVTAGIARNEEIVFRGSGADWEKFCREELGFEPPAWCTQEGVAAAQQ